MGVSVRRLMVTTLSIVLAGLLQVSVGSASAYADGGTSLRIEGTVTRADPGLSGAQVGDPLVLEVEIDDSAAPTSSAATGATYPAVTAATVTANGTPVLAAAGGVVSLTNDAMTGTGTYLDEYRMQFSGVTQLSTISPAPPWTMGLVLRDEGNTPSGAMAGVALTAAPPDPSRFQQSGFSVTFRDLSACAEDDFDIACWRVSSLVARVDRILGGGPDGDGDGVADAIGAVDGSGTSIPGGFDDRSGTGGQILNGSGILVEDAAAPEGVRITTTEPVSLSVCGGFTLNLSGGSDVTVTCGSVTVRVAEGTTRIDLGNGSNVTVPQGGDVTADRMTSGDFQVTNNGSAPVGITRGNVDSTVAPGAVAYSFPQTKGDCKKGGWAEYGVFKNQGHCVSQVAR